MIEIEKPNLSLEESHDGAVAKFVVEPLDRGFGQTIGNAIRRTLLGSLAGSAAVGIRIPTVEHEFTNIDGVIEDVVEIILNVKEIAFKTAEIDTEFSRIVKIVKNEAGVVTAGDIIETDLVSVMNKDQYICTLNEGKSFEMEIQVGCGRGYVNASMNKELFDTAGWIAVDSLYSPVKKVNYSVETARKGQSMDYDKLTVEVETNGTTSAKEVVSLAAKLIQDHTMLFVSLIEGMSSMNLLAAKVDESKTQILETSIEDMDLTIRSYNCLKRANINKVEDLTKRSKDDMLKVRNLGVKSLEEVISKLEAMGLGLKGSNE